MKKVFITRRLPEVAKEILKKNFVVHCNDKNEPYPPVLLTKLADDYDAILCTVSEKFDKTSLSESRRLKVISNYATGLDNIDHKYAKSIGISVYNTPNAVTNSTADLTFSILLSLIRKISSAEKFVKNNHWNAWDPEIFLGEELNGKLLGIIGFGKIGQAVAKRAIGFGMNVIYYNRSIKNIGHLTADDSLIRHSGIDEVLEKSDYLSIHLPLTEDTNNFINKNLINKMKKNPIILNMARGEILNTDDLIEALKLKKIRGAGLDVIASEPISGSHPLCRFENCIILPHIGTATTECRNEMARDAANNIYNHFF